MATSIEQIFRSFVVSKFREIQEQQQQLCGGKVELQQNGEINSSEQANASDDTVASVGNLQNDQIVQKIEEVLSGVLDKEPQYKPDAEEYTVKNTSHSTKRSSCDESQDEIPRKKSKKNKKHKKKKRKKEKKEKKHKKQPRELIVCHGIRTELQSTSHLQPEESGLELGAKHIDTVSASPLLSPSELPLEKLGNEKTNSALPNSHNALNSETNKLDILEDDSSISENQGCIEVELIKGKQLESDTCDSINHISINLNVGERPLTVNEAENGTVFVVRTEVGSNAEIEKDLEATPVCETEKVKASEMTQTSVIMEENGLERADVIADVDLMSESLHTVDLKNSVAFSFETEAEKKHLEKTLESEPAGALESEPVGEMKVSEATVEFLHTAEVNDLESIQETEIAS
uniref:Uncharacterized protein n=1 Tax=Sphenodon punctatus TaxID=8508 RepID=A0A8D0H007_SPHPU